MADMKCEGLEDKLSEFHSCRWKTRAKTTNARIVAFVRLSVTRVVLSAIILVIAAMVLTLNLTAIADSAQAKVLTYRDSTIGSLMGS